METTAHPAKRCSDISWRHYIISRKNENCCIKCKVQNSMQKGRKKHPISLMAWYFGGTDNVSVWRLEGTKRRRLQNWARFQGNGGNVSHVLDKQEAWHRPGHCVMTYVASEFNWTPTSTVFNYFFLPGCLGGVVRFMLRPLYSREKKGLSSN
jgi:hypothetical protein